MGGGRDGGKRETGGHFFFAPENKTNSPSPERKNEKFSGEFGGKRGGKRTVPKETRKKDKTKGNLGRKHNTRVKNRGKGGRTTKKKNR